jgi:hypothetical protein
MTEELKPCRFCGSEASFDAHSGKDYCTNETCNASQYPLVWQSRPIEDQLKDEIRWLCALIRTSRKLDTYSSERIALLNKATAIMAKYGWDK